MKIDPSYRLNVNRLNQLMEEDLKLGFDGVETQESEFYKPKEVQSIRTYPSDNLIREMIKIIIFLSGFAVLGLVFIDRISEKVSLILEQTNDFTKNNENIEVSSIEVKKISPPDHSQVLPEFSQPSSTVIEFPRVIHIQADDRSASALNHQNLQQKHFQSISARNYAGDHFIQVDFADRPVTTYDSSLVISSNASSKSYGIGHDPGTSLIRLLEHLLTIAREKRDAGYLEPISISISIHEFEPGPGQPVMDKEGLNQMAQLISALEREGSVISIIGLNPSLRDKLQNYFENNQRRLCSASQLDQCVQWTMHQARSSVAVSSL